MSVAAAGRERREQRPDGESSKHAPDSHVATRKSRPRAHSLKSSRVTITILISY